MGEPVWNRISRPPGHGGELHRENIHLMVSVWPSFDPGSPVYDDDGGKRACLSTGRCREPPIPKTRWRSTTPVQSRSAQLLLELMDGGLFKMGMDAWWLDTTEPETEGREEYYSA